LALGLNGGTACCPNDRNSSSAAVVEAVAANDRRAYRERIIVNQLPDVLHHDGTIPCEYPEMVFIYPKEDLIGNSAQL
jgi:hypothetical protein